MERIKELNTPVPRAVYFFLIPRGTVFDRLLDSDARLAARLELREAARHRSDNNI